MNIINIAGYRFVPLEQLPELQDQFQKKCNSLGLLGTILLSIEGININLAGTTSCIDQFIAFLQLDNRFKDIAFHRCQSDFTPFEQLKIKIKPEIITMRSENIHPEVKTAPHITPQEFKQWLDEKRDITILDTRNDYEVRFGTFKNAINPKIQEFSEFTHIAKIVDPQKPVVMFCTGGIRCEKAALHLLQTGFQHVFQLQGGILNYFKQVGGDHYEGECFVFDQRIAVDANLQVTGTQQCKQCHNPVRNKEVHHCNS